MPISRPRRIFRANSLAAPRRGYGRGFGMGRTMAAGVIGALGGAALVILVLPSELFGRVPLPSGLVTAEPQQVAVVDGETLRLRETVIRLEGISAPPRGHACGRADATGFDCGAAAAEALALMVRGRDVACRLNGRDEAGLPQGACEAGGQELNRALVLAGWAKAQSHSAATADSSVTASLATLGPAEAQARTERRGVWRDGDRTTW